MKIVVLFVLFVELLCHAICQPRLLGVRLADVKLDEDDARTAQMQEEAAAMDSIWAGLQELRKTDPKVHACLVSAAAAGMGSRSTKRSTRSLSTAKIFSAARGSAGLYRYWT